MTAMLNAVSACPAPRRRFLSQLGAAAALSGLLPARSALAAGASLPARRALSFHSLHTDERLTVTYFRGGRYDPEGLAEIDFILRDWRSGRVRRIDRDLLDLLYALRLKLDSRAPIEIISGYRSPTTNATLAAKSDGVAKRSLHVRGMAIDFRLSDRRLEAVHRAALALQGGGVGLYSRSGFLHLDTGRVRRWGA